MVSFPARAQEAATFHCTFKAVYETAESDNAIKSNFEKQFVGHRCVCHRYADSKSDWRRVHNNQAGL
jgi:hypothetical protein